MSFSDFGDVVSFGDDVGTGSVTAGVAEGSVTAGVSVTFGSCDVGAGDVFSVGFGELLAVSPLIG